MPILNQSNTQWDVKYLREGFAMPFGSMCKAFSEINQGKGMEMDKFLDAMESIFQKSNEFVERNFNGIEQIKEDSEQQI